MLSTKIIVAVILIFSQFTAITGVRKNAINVENQLKGIRKNMHQRYQNGQRKPHNQNQLECKVEDKSKWYKKQHLLWATR